MSDTPSPAADDLDPALGERYYKNSRETEEKCTDDIIALIRRAISGRVERGECPARRDAHAFDNGCVRAVFRVDPDLKPELRHGAFVPGREYPAWIRFSNGNVERRSSRWPDARGMAIKLMGVEGAKLCEDETQSQDFILISHPVFFVDDLERYTGALDEFLKGGVIDQFVRSPARLKLREALLAYVANANWIVNPLNQQYWSMTPYRLGNGAQATAVKYVAKPRLAARDSAASRLAAFWTSGFSPKQEMSRSLAGGEMWFDFFVQRRVDERTPVEDTTVEWKESVAPLERVGKIVVPMQDILSAQQDFFCEHLSFNPWHCLAAHKPLGLVNRVRRKVYTEISRHRHRLNAVEAFEPTGAERFDQ